MDLWGPLVVSFTSFYVFEDNYKTIEEDFLINRYNSNHFIRYIFK